MANIMNLKSLRNNVSRNGFDLSFKKNFTAKAGELLPVMVKEVLPGDKFSINLSSFTRTQPINTAAFARMREYYDFFFVPYNLLWNKADTVLTQMYDNPQHSNQIDPSFDKMTGQMPYITAEQIVHYIYTRSLGFNTLYGKNYFGYDRSSLSCKLLEYLGYGNYHSFLPETLGVSHTDSYDSSTTGLINNLAMNVFPLLAYQKIYADFFRDSQWEKISPSTFNVDYMTGTTDMQIPIPFNTSDTYIKSAFFTNYNFFDLRYCNWQKDLFHGLMPHSQYGASSYVPVDVVNTEDTSSFTSVSRDDGKSVIRGQADMSILLLRQYEFLQKWKEIAQSGNKDYKEQVNKHWNVAVGDYASEMCQYLGGVTTNIDINEVVNTNITESNAADIAGKGTSCGRGSINFDSNGKYGLLMCIYHCLPLLDYTTDTVDPAVTKVNSTDFAIPEFDNIGMQAVPFAWLCNAAKGGSLGSSNVEFNMGYAPRYIEYKTSVDSSVGAFKTTLNSWVMSYGNDSMADALQKQDENNASDSSSDLLLNYTYLKVNPNSVDPIFGVAADSTIDTDQFLCSTFFDIKAVRNLSVDGLPY